MLEYELHKLKSENMIKISKQKFWDSVMHRASIYQKGFITPPKSAYSISTIEGDKIYINNLRTGRKNSQFFKKNN